MFEPYGHYSTMDREGELLVNVFPLENTRAFISHWNTSNKLT